MTPPDPAGPRLCLRPARPDEGPALSALAFDAKAALGYAPAQMERWREALRIDPGVASAQREVPEAQIVGAMPAESAFRHARDGRYDLVVAMFHDQATIASKLVDFGEAVNVTLGLPFIRTSVDHGTAYDIAGRGVADPHGMLAALRLAVRMARSRAQVVLPPQDEPAPAVHPKQ